MHFNIIQLVILQPLHRWLLHKQCYRFGWAPLVSIHGNTIHISTNSFLAIPLCVAKKKIQAAHHVVPVVEISHSVSLVAAVVSWV